MRLPRFRIRTLMVAVAVVGRIVGGSIQWQRAEFVARSTAVAVAVSLVVTGSPCCLLLLLITRDHKAARVSGQRLVKER